MEILYLFTLQIGQTSEIHMDKTKQNKKPHIFKFLTILYSIKTVVQWLRERERGVQTFNGQQVSFKVTLKACRYFGNIKQTYTLQKVHRILYIIGFYYACHLTEICIFNLCKANQNWLAQSERKNFEFIWFSVFLHFCFKSNARKAMKNLSFYSS